MVGAHATLVATEGVGCKYQPVKCGGLPNRRRPFRVSAIISDIGRATRECREQVYEFIVG